MIGRTLLAVKTAGDDPRCGGLARTPLAGEYIAVRDAVLRDGVFEGGLDVFLVDHVLERLGPVFPGDHLIHGVGECQAPGDPRHTG